MNALVIISCLFLIATVTAQGDGGKHHVEEYLDYHAPPHYHYDYSVHDPKHHDFKNQKEERDHHKTKGEYSLLQPDGKKRIVEYEVGKHGAVYHIKYEPHH